MLKVSKAGKRHLKGLFDFNNPEKISTGNAKPITNARLSSAIDVDANAKLGKKPKNNTLKTIRLLSV